MLPRFLSRIRRHDLYAGQFEHVEVLPERPGTFAEPARPLPPALAELLAARGIEQLYSHQVAALELARAGRDLVVVTGTASGKTLCYNLPILETCSPIPTPGRCICFRPRPWPRISTRAARAVWRRACRRSSGFAAACSTATRPRRSGGAFRPRRTGAVESRHAARLDPAVSSQVGPVLQRPAVRRHRRDPHLSRHPGGERGLRAAAAGARLRALRLAAGVSGGQRHDRQPGRVGRQAARPRRGSGRRRRRAARPQVLRAVEPQRRWATTGWPAAAPPTTPWC